MRVVDIIQKKRDNIELTKQEIDVLFDGYLENKVPDYQMSAFLMAVYFNSMTEDELTYITLKMRDSGDIINFENIDKFLVDKHSTGGVGDKVTIALAPILSALGMGTAKLSGKGLGHTGGTIDKFESIKGFEFSQTKEDLVNIANKTGIGLMGYSDKIVPLDKKIYGLRDVTATVKSIPLIASSIMSKKLAIQSDVIILDVKVGDGAFAKNLEEGKLLAKHMIEIGRGANRDVKVVLTNMDEPLGFNVGNATEIIEAIEFLKGNSSEDLKEVIYSIASLALKSKKEITNLEDGYKLIDEVIENGSALNKLREFIKESGGDDNLVNDYSLLPRYKYTKEVYLKQGYIKRIHTENVGKAAMVIGAGRAFKDDVIDHGVGILIHKKVGGYISDDKEIVAEIFYNSEDKIEEAYNLLVNSFEITDEKVEPQKAILEIIE